MSTHTHTLSSAWPPEATRSEVSGRRAVRLDIAVSIRWTSPMLPAMGKMAQSSRVPSSKSALGLWGAAPCGCCPWPRSGFNFVQFSPSEQDPQASDTGSEIASSALRCHGRQRLFVPHFSHVTEAGQIILAMHHDMPRISGNVQQSGLNPGAALHPQAQAGSPRPAELDVIFQGVS